MGVCLKKPEDGEEGKEKGGKGKKKAKDTDALKSVTESDLIFPELEGSTNKATTERRQGHG